MPEKSQKEMVQEIWQGLYGVAGNNDENGLVGDFKAFKEQFCKQCESTDKKFLKTWIAIGVILLILTGAGIADWAGIIQIIGG